MTAPPTFSRWVTELGPKINAHHAARATRFLQPASSQTRTVHRSMVRR